MKRLFCFFMSLILCLTLLGCKKNINSITPITRNLSFKAEVTFYNESFEADVFITDKDGMVIELTHPEDISGLKFNIKSGNITATYKGLEYKTTDSNMPHKNIAGFLYEAFSLSNSEVFEEDDNYFVEGKTTDYSYRMFIGSSGLPIKIEEKSGIINVIIKNTAIL